MKIVAFRDDGWFDATTDFRTWDHLCRAYAVEFQLITEWDEVRVGDSKVYVLDEGGDQELAEHVVDLDGIYVFGRTGLDLRLAVPSPDAIIGITTPAPIALFGHCAAAILLRHMWLSR